LSFVVGMDTHLCHMADLTIPYHTMVLLFHRLLLLA
jgi:hypothetical protein